MSVQYVSMSVQGTGHGHGVGQRKEKVWAHWGRRGLGHRRHQGEQPGLLAAQAEAQVGGGHHRGHWVDQGVEGPRGGDSRVGLIIAMIASKDGSLTDILNIENI